MRVGFGRAEISPTPGSAKIGFLRRVVGWGVLDPLFARAIVWSTESVKATLVVLDTLSVSARHVSEIRRALADECGLEPRHVMIAATHNHAGPAIVALGDVPVDVRAARDTTRAIVRAVRDALARSAPAEVAFGRTFNTAVAENRRMVMRDGTARTLGSFDDPDALYVEGPVDPEITLLAFRAPHGERIGLLMSFACHPIDKGAQDVFSAGWPGVATRAIEAAGWPHAVFANGAFGNVTPIRRAGLALSMEEVGIRLANAALQGERALDYRSEATVSAASVTVSLPFRELSPEEIAGEARGAQRLVDSKIYDRCIPRIAAKIEAEGVERTEVQAMAIGGLGLVGIPGELFVELGLEIKERAHPLAVAVIGAANGMVGYVPHAAAFERGGYEVTFGPTSWLGPGAGAVVVDAAQRLIREVGGKST